MAINNLLNESSTGLQSLSSSGSVVGRTITGTSNQISVSNGDGISGSPTLSLTSTIEVSGISFDSGSNTLSVYTTGTYTPVLTGGTSNPTVAYSVQVGRYTKVGNRVFVCSTVTLSSATGGTGALQMSTPFTSVTASGNLDHASIIENITLTSTNSVAARIGSSLAFSTFAKTRAGLGVQTVSTTDLTNTSRFTFSLMYEV